MRDAMMFVDAQNYQNGARAYEDGFRADAIAVRERLLADYYTVRAYWFDSYKDRENKQDFFKMLRMNGYTVVSTPLRKRDGRWVEKGVESD